jgi:hypothetical protein
MIDILRPHHKMKARQETWLARVAVASRHLLLTRPALFLFHQCLMSTVWCISHTVATYIHVRPTSGHPNSKKLAVRADCPLNTQFKNMFLGQLGWLL